MGGDCFTKSLRHQKFRYQVAYKALLGRFPYTAYIGEYLHFGYLKSLMIVSTLGFSLKAIKKTIWRHFLLFFKEKKNMFFSSQNPGIPKGLLWWVCPRRARCRCRMDFTRWRGGPSSWIYPPPSQISQGVSKWFVSGLYPTSQWICFFWWFFSILLMDFFVQDNFFFCTMVNHHLNFDFGNFCQASNKQMPGISSWIYIPRAPSDGCHGLWFRTRNMMKHFQGFQESWHYSFCHWIPGG